MVDKEVNLPPLSASKLHPKTAAMQPPYPHMRVPECKFLESYLKQHHVMLEWGSGYSTLRFSQQVAEYYSIEHDKMWSDKIRPQISGNVHYYYTGGATLPGPKKRTAPGYRADKWHRPAPSWDKIGGSLRSRQFKNYIHTVDHIDRTFDIVFIDGRARCECAKQVITHTTPTTLIFFHNWNRPFYQIILKRYNLIKKVQTMALLKPK